MVAFNSMNEVEAGTEVVSLMCILLTSCFHCRTVETNFYLTSRAFQDRHFEATSFAKKLSQYLNSISVSMFTLFFYFLITGNHICLRDTPSNSFKLSFALET